MKKILATAAAAVLAAATLSAGEGLKVSGFVRGGLSDDITDSVADASHSKADDTVIGNSWVGGDHWGGSSRFRFRTQYDGDMGGVDFRYQRKNLKLNWFDEKNISWAMAYAKFFDGAIMVEGGKLVDNYTGADDDNGADFTGATGVRLVVHPVDSLYVTFMGSDLNPAFYSYTDEEIAKDAKKARRNNNEKFDANLFSATARFENDAFAIVGGAHFSGIFYGSFNLKAVENLTFNVGFQSDYSKWHEGTEAENSDAKKAYQFTLVDATLEYNADPVLFGVVGYAWFADDKYLDNENNSKMATVNPYVQYKLSDIVALRAEATTYISRDTDVKDHYTTVTPSVVFNASKKADVNVWLTISSDTDQAHHATGVGVKYAF